MASKTNTLMSKMTCGTLSLALCLMLAPCVANADEQNAAEDGYLANADGDYIKQLSEEETGATLAELADSSDVATTSLQATDNEQIVTFSGEDMFETAALEAQYAYPNGCTTAIIAGSGGAWVDALSASSLAAGVGPILFSYQDSVPQHTLDALKALGVTSVIIVGGPACIGDGAISTLSNAGISVATRLYGDDCYATQRAIYNYGVEKGIWTGDDVFIASAAGFGDALSISPVAYKLKAPIFLTTASADLPSESKQLLAEVSKKGNFSRVVAVGGEAVVSERTMGFLDAISLNADGTGAERVWGDDQYKTSVAIANWAVNEKGYLSNSSLAFSTGSAPYDALAGSVVQGMAESPILLVHDLYRDGVTYAASNKSSVGQVKFFGGTAVVSESVRSAIIAGVFGTIVEDSTGVSLSTMANYEYEAYSKYYRDYTYSEIKDIIGAGCDLSSKSCYQYAELDNGYSGVSASSLNSYIASTAKGAAGKLANQGQVFIDAAKKYGVNEVYLLSHAILESAWGTSTLAQGWTFDTDVTDANGNVLYHADGKTYYNFYGIGAYDASPISGGRLMAYKQGWDSIEKAIYGAAEWISAGSNGSGCYFNNRYNQNTLYKMRWNYTQVASESACWKQYATDPLWAEKIATIMYACYSSAGIGAADSGLIFKVPSYS